MEKLLEVRGLTIQYDAGGAHPQRAVDGVCFDIACGEVVGLMGESGCGKSSIALAVLALLGGESAAVSGAISFRGQELLKMDERSLAKIRGAEISLVFQEPGISLSPMMRAGEQVAEVIHAHRGGSWKDCREEAEAMLARVGLEETKRIFSAYPHQLSGGQRQRVVLAQALACGPALLIADEPTASLDARSQAEFVALLRRLKEETEISILLISHTPETQASLADRLLVMKDGRIVEEGDFEEIYRNPRHDYTGAILRRAARRGENHFDAEAEIIAEEQLVR
ncbi:MAG: ABC transporter ATP-binding protein [Candidatus Acidiferrales bacterium]